MVIFALCMACLFASPSAVLGSNVREASYDSMHTMLCKMSNKLRIQYGASVGISVICVTVITINRTITFFIIRRLFRWDLCVPVNLHFSPVRFLIPGTFALLVVVTSSLI
jgi:hypothetical protein